MQSKHRITMKDIARDAGVSVATVSYVLNRSAKISDQTRQKVLDVVNALGYTPNSIAVSLKTSRSRTVGVLVEDITVFSTPAIVDGIHASMEQVQYQILLNNLGLDRRIHHSFGDATAHIDLIRTAVDTLLARQVEGLIYVGMHPRDVANLLVPLEQPVVFAYCYSSQPDSYSVNCDDQKAAFLVCSHLFDQGCRKIAVISGPPDSIPSQRRLAGVGEAARKYGIPWDIDLVFSGEWTYESGRRQAREIFRRSEQISAIFAMNDEMAVGAVDEAMQWGIAVPQQLRVVGFDNREFSSYYRPRLSTVDLPLRHLGEKAAQLLINRLEGERLSPAEILLPCKVLPRETG